MLLTSENLFESRGIRQNIEPLDTAKGFGAVRIMGEQHDLGLSRNGRHPLTLHVPVASKILHWQETGQELQLRLEHRHCDVG